MRLTVRQARRLADKTQAEMAQALGINRSTYLYHEKNPEKFTVVQAQRFCKIVGVRMEQVFPDEE